MKLHCPKSKEALPKKAPRLIEGTMGQLSEVERDAITKEIQEGWSSGNIVFGTHSVSFNLVTTRRSLN